MDYPLNSCLIWLFLFLFYHLRCVSSEQEYGFCERVKFQCGNIEVGSPFWGGNRPVYCGREFLRLNCIRQTITTLNISNSVYHVLNINESSNTLRLVRADFLGSFCSAKFNSTTLPLEISELSPNYKSITISHHCDPYLHYDSSHICPGINVISAYVKPKYQRFCQENFTVIVPTSYVPEKKELDMTHLESVLRRGFEVTVEEDEIRCEGCSYSPLQSYALCNKPFTCGDQSLLYPFWGRGRQNCGHPDFEVDCSGKFPEFNFSFVKFRILNSNYNSRMIKVSRFDYNDKACLFPRNQTLPESVLTIAPNNKNLTIYYGCQNLSSLHDSPANVYNGKLVCDDDDYEDEIYRNQRKAGNLERTINYYVTNSISSNLSELKDSCQSNINIPTSGNMLNILPPDQLKKTLEQGYELKLSQDCSNCLDSKGACGYNLTSGGFVCYCNNGHYGNDCISRSHETWIKPVRIFSGSVAGVVLFLVLLALFHHFLRMRKTRMRHQKLKALIPLEHYSYAQVKRITKSFAEVVGRGGFGIVYRGTLGDGRMVAVKVLKDSQGNGEDFINEVASMSRTSHLNIVSLLGFCSEGSKRAIIYEFLGNGSLDKFISDKSSVTLDCITLYRIALGVARGLEYLHHSCKTRIVHFDIKPQNVLLDENFCPKVSDFGLAKLCEKKESILSMLDTRGTVGYIAPEMISRVYGNVSHKSDVYSYGMLVLEMIGARNKEKNMQASTSSSNTSSMYFPDWVYRDLELGNCGKHIESGINSEDNELVKKMTLVGLWCIQPSPPDRPPMNRVVEMMEGSLDAIEIPPKPVFQIPIVPLQESSIFSEDISIYTENDPRSLPSIYQNTKLI